MVPLPRLLDAAALVIAVLRQSCVIQENGATPSVSFLQNHSTVCVHTDNPLLQQGPRDARFSTVSPSLLKVASALLTTASTTTPLSWSTATTLSPVTSSVWTASQHRNPVATEEHALETSMRYLRGLPMSRPSDWFLRPDRFEADLRGLVRLLQDGVESDTGVNLLRKTRLATVHDTADARVTLIRKDTPPQTRCMGECAIGAIAVYWACALECVHKLAPNSCITTVCQGVTAGAEASCLKYCKDHYPDPYPIDTTTVTTTASRTEGTTSAAQVDEDAMVV
ncbi:unnamed protein product [Amoebophrya sp. A120]|nr:unnamed protein product [Amoebophrya sp. A120]|eukprot:GSA120T00002054001.1